MNMSENDGLRNCDLLSEAVTRQKISIDVLEKLGQWSSIRRID